MESCSIWVLASLDQILINATSSTSKEVWTGLDNLIDNKDPTSKIQDTNRTCRRNGKKILPVGVKQKCSQVSHRVTDVIQNRDNF